MIEYGGSERITSCPVELGATYEAGDLVDFLIDNPSCQGEKAVVVQCNVEMCAVRALVQKFEASGTLAKSYSVYNGDKCANR